MTGTLQYGSSLSARRLLVVAPHPDDEALGCGGLIHDFSRRGRHICVVFVTDGGASHPGSALWRRERLAALREQEAADALMRLGAGDAERHFLRLRDADMPAEGSSDHAEALAFASAIIRNFGPDLALLPWRRDPHRDHRDSWSLFTQAFEAAPSRPPTLEYAIWLDEIGRPEDHPRAEEMERISFDIASAMTAKHAAVAAHRSQTTAMIDDDPGGFRLTAETIERLVGPNESYWRPLS